MLPEFELLMPLTLPEALDWLAAGAPAVTPLAGGTSLLVDMRGGSSRPGVLMDVAGLDELHGIRQEDGHVVVGSGVTIAELLDDPLIAQYASVLRQAATSFANPLVRNRATLGGNLAYGSPAADTAPPLLVLGAEVELASQAGTRRVPLEDFWVGVRQTIRRPDELLTSIRWPVPSPDSASAFCKLALRKADAISVVNAAVMVEYFETRFFPENLVSFAPAPMCRHVRIALGAVAPRPLRARAAEDILRNRPLTPAAIAEAARLAADATSCIDDVRGSAGYRRRVTEVLVRRLLSDIIRNQVFS
jgi:carbon-monoxide dehydrogenase medium subunit